VESLFNYVVTFCANHLCDHIELSNILSHEIDIIYRHLFYKWRQQNMLVDIHPLEGVTCAISQNE